MLRAELKTDRDVVGEPAVSESRWTRFPVEALTQYWADQRQREVQAARDSSTQATRSAAYVLSAVAVVFFAAADWTALYTLRDVLPLWPRFGTSLAVLAVCQVSAWIAHRRGNRRIAELLTFACLLLSVVTTVVVLDSNEFTLQDNIWLRADRILVLSLIPMVLLADAPLVYLAFAVMLGLSGYVDLFSVTASVEPFRFHYLLLAGVLAGFAWGYRRSSPLVVGANVTLLALWLLCVPFHWHPEQYLAFASVSVGVIGLFVAEAHRDPGLAAAWRLTALTLIGIPLNFLENPRIWPDLAPPLPSPAPPDLLMERAVCESFLAMMLLMAFLVPFRMYLARRRVETPPGAVWSEFLRRFWLAATLGVLSALLTLWHCSPLASALWQQTPAVVASVASLLMAAYLIDVGTRQKNGYATTAGLLCAARVLYHNLLHVETPEGGPIALGLLSAFGLMLVALAVSWLRWQPAAVDATSSPPSPWELPIRLQRLCAGVSARTAWLLIVAFGLQQASLLLLPWTLEPIHPPRPRTLSYADR